MVTLSRMSGIPGSPCPTGFRASPPVTDSPRGAGSSDWAPRSCTTRSGSSRRTRRRERPSSGSPRRSRSRAARPSFGRPRASVHSRTRPSWLSSAPRPMSATPRSPSRRRRYVASARSAGWPRPPPRARPSAARRSRARASARIAPGSLPRTGRREAEHAIQAAVRLLLEPSRERGRSNAVGH